MLKRILLYFLAGMLALLTASCSSPSETSKKVAAFYVATDGNDKNAGTIKKPFKTIEAAKAAVRELLSKPGTLSGDVYVYIRGGTYLMPDTLTFNAADSGKDGQRIIYSGYQDEQATLSAAVALDGWINTDSEFSGVSGVYKTKLPDQIDDIYCLYEDQARAYPARFPNKYKDENQYVHLADGSDAGTLQAKVSRVLPAGADYSFAQMVVWPGSHNDDLQYDWYSSVDPIEHYDDATGVFKLALATWWDISAGNRYYVQNVKQFLDVPGEFYFDRDNRDVYYKPFGDIEKVVILAPTGINTIRLAGEPDDQVHDITLTKLNIGYSNFSESFSGLGDALRSEGMIRLENCRNIVIDSCHLFNSGYSAVSIWGYSDQNEVTGNLIENCGIGGVYIGMEYEQLPGRIDNPQDGQISKNNLIQNNIIRNVGQTSPGHGYGVFLYQSGFNKVTENTFYNIPKAAVNLYNTQTGYLVMQRKICGLEVNDENADSFKYCRSNEISYNDIFDVMKDGSDCGGIITYGVGSGNIIDSNFLHDYTGIEGGTTMGIYLDDNSDGVMVSNNIVARIGGSSFINGAMLKGRDITLKNNIFYNTRATYGVIATMITRVAVWNLPQERTEDLVLDNNIVFEDQPVTYLYYLWGLNYQGKTIKEQNYNNYFTIDFPSVGYSVFGDDKSGKDDQWLTVMFGQYMKNMLAEGLAIDSEVSWKLPEFVSPADNNFMLKETSPALALGFIQIDTSYAGINGSYPFQSEAAQAKELSNVKNQN